MIAVAIPMLLLALGIVWHLAERERETSREAILYASRSIRSSVDAQLRNYIAVGYALAGSPSLLAGDLAGFRKEAERATTGLPGAWVSLADAAGQQVVNTLVPSDSALPRLAPSVETYARRAFETGRVQFPDLVIGPVAGAPVVSIGIPIFRGTEPAYFLQVAARADAFRDLLNDQGMPAGWLVAVIDSKGAFIARSLDHDRWVGKPAAPGWRARMHENGIIENETLEGRSVVTASAVSVLSGWVVGVASEKGLLERKMWQTMAAAALAALLVSVASGMLAALIARRITAPMEALKTGARLLEHGEKVELPPTRVPEIDRALHAFASAAVGRVAREQAVATLQTELWHVSRLSEMGQLAAALAHELNQPLTALAVYVGGCRRIMDRDHVDERGQEQVRKLLQSISDQALRAGEIIKQLRSFVQKGEAERRIEDAGTVMREACKLAMTAAKHKDVTIRCDIDGTSTVLVNKVQIQQVVFNLIRNAIEATEACPRREIVLAVETQDGEVETSVADTGTGLAPEMADRLFRPFASTKSQGMGIGLSVCRDIIEAHQGRIWAEANTGGGTVFRFTLPVVPEEQAEEQAEERLSPTLTT